jgi:uncharacterized membrane protein
MNKRVMEVLWIDLRAPAEMQLLAYVFRTVDLALKSSFDTYPTHCSVLLFFAVASVVAMLVFVVVVVVVVAVVAVVAALRAWRKQSMYSSSLASVLENSVAGLW